MKPFLKYLLLFVLFCAETQAQSSRPNIIMFMVDDMGWQDTSVPFWEKLTQNNGKYKTPNMARLAAKGVKFTQAYATPVCTPTRVSLISGMNALRHGVTNWTSPENGENSDGLDEELELDAWNMAGCSPIAGIPNTVHITPFPQILKDQGYFTVHAGKAHWGALGTPAANPTNLGFVVNVGGAATGHPQSYHGEDNYGNKAPRYSTHAVPDLEAYFGSTTFLSEAITNDALKALDYPIAQNLPFFLYLSHYAVHTPIMADSSLVQKYLDKGFAPVEANYASLVEGMDKSLGQVLDFLEDKKIDDETIILFMSDNGGLGNEHPAGKKANHDNAPLKSGKGSVNEGGIREPMMAFWPGVTQAGTVCTQPIIIEDFFPTILEMAGIKEFNTVQQTDGQSFVPFLKNRNQQTSRELVWYYPHNWGANGPGIDYFAALRKDDYKLIWDIKAQKLSLFDLSKDIEESQDLSAKMPEKTRELAERMQALLDERKAPVLHYKVSKKPVRVPF
ncbi:sulfatase [Marinilongibacter aquaticus]|uniref:sulfatase n=1 Tax=Marinilongibacter aquaticus TaxID=2975157 RepID=UPI0021BD3DB4|nr:sulfatase [Marinilongibacter aquaticus]UBM59045.1 sulfatase [Marinilongibacter aquaticus]